jgi:NAD(P)H-quinone oxidoreductase subunit 4
MLSALLWLPALGAAVVGFLPGKMNAMRVRSVASFFAAAVFLLNLWLLTQFDTTNAGLQFQEYLPWIPQLGLSYNLGIDGLSLPLLVLTGLLTLLVIYGTGEGMARPQLYYALILLINAGVAGALMSQNLLLFVLFYELELIPFYLLIAIWGGKQREYAAMKFLIYTAVSGLLVLGGFWA